jgi:group I intron endonuclease
MPVIGVSKSIEKRCGIYRFQNLENGRFYIGSSKNLYLRYYRHIEFIKSKKVGNHKIYEDIKNIESPKFVFGVIEYCQESERLDREQYYFELYKPYYNCTPTVYDAKGYKWPNSLKEKNKNIFHGPKDMDKHSNSLKESWKRRREKYTPEQLSEKMADARRGIKHSDESKLKMSLSGKGKKKPEGFAEKIRQARLRDSVELKEYRNSKIRESKMR